MTQNKSYKYKKLKYHHTSSFWPLLNKTEYQTQCKHKHMEAKQLMSKWKFSQIMNQERNWKWNKNLYNATSLKGCLWKKGEGIVRTSGGRWFQRKSRQNTHINPQRLWQHAQDLHKLKSHKILVLRNESKHKVSHFKLRSYFQLVIAMRVEISFCQ